MQCPHMSTTVLLAGTVDSMDQAQLILTANLDRLRKEGYVIRSATVYPMDGEKYQVHIKASNRKI